MNARIWVVVFRRDGKQLAIISVQSQGEAEQMIYHNTYYGRRCLKITVKAWR